MPEWRLKEYLRREHEIGNAVQLQNIIRERLGVEITVQTLRSLLRRTPAAPRGDLIQLLCDALGCRSDAFYFFEPDPDRAKSWAEQKQKGAGASPLYARTSKPPVEKALPPPAVTSQGDESRRGRRTPAQIFRDPKEYFKGRLDDER